MSRLRWLRFFVWVPLFGLLLGLAAVAARTQILFAYRYTGGSGLQGRHDTRCTYVGLSGSTTLAAEAGRCAWFRLPLAGGR